MDISDLVKSIKSIIQKELNMLNANSFRNSHLSLQNHNIIHLLNVSNHIAELLIPKMLSDDFLIIKSEIVIANDLGSKMEDWETPVSLLSIILNYILKGRPQNFMEQHLNSSILHMAKLGENNDWINDSIFKCEINGTKCMAFAHNGFACGGYKFQEDYLPNKQNAPMDAYQIAELFTNGKAATLNHLEKIAYSDIADDSEINHLKQYFSKIDDVNEADFALISNLNGPFTMFAVLKNENNEAAYLLSPSRDYEKSSEKSIFGKNIKFAQFDGWVIRDISQLDSYHKYDFIKVNTKTFS